LKSQSCVRKQQAAALLIVLAFVVILTALAVAYLSRTTTDRTVAHSSFKVSTANQLAESATNIVIGDLRQEIVNGSTAVTISPAPSAGPFAVYVQTQNAYMMPARSGNPSGSPDPIPNLVRRSVNNDPLANNPGLGSRASAVNSTTDSSANARYVTLARWNKHYLIPRHNQSDTPTDTTPISPVAFSARARRCDWLHAPRLGDCSEKRPRCCHLELNAGRFYAGKR